MEILSTPDMSVLSYIGIVALLFGAALLFSAFGIIKIEQITVQSDKKAKIAGGVLLILGVAFILPEVVGAGNRADQTLDMVTPTQTPESSLSAIATHTPTPEPVAMSDVPVFSDDFDGGLAEEWQVITGRYIVNENAPYLAEGDAGLVVLGNADWDNFAVEVDLIAPPQEKRVLGNGIGVIFAYRNTSSLDAHSFVGFSKYRIGEDLIVDLHIAGEKGNIDLDFDPKKVGGDAPYKLRLEIRGETLLVMVNGETLFEVNDVGQSLAGPVGLYSYEQGEALKFDNFMVTELP